MTRRKVTRRTFGLGAAALAPVALSGCLGAITGGGHEHEHEDPPWEWGGLYELAPGTYTYTYYEGSDPDMLLALVPTDESGEHGLYHAGETATELFEKEESDTVITDGTSFEPSEDTLYRVDFADTGETEIHPQIDTEGEYSIFTAHVPDEFDADLHSEDGERLTPSVSETHSSHDHGDDGHDH